KKKTRKSSEHMLRANSSMVAGVMWPFEIELEMEDDLKKPVFDFIERRRAFRRFFVRAMFFGKFLRYYDIKYAWNRYGINTIDAFDFHEDSLFFLHAKAKRLFLTGLFKTKSFYTKAVDRLSFLNSSFRLNPSVFGVYSVFSIEDNFYSSKFALFPIRLKFLNGMEVNPDFFIFKNALDIPKIQIHNAVVPFTESLFCYWLFKMKIFFMVHSHNITRLFVINFFSTFSDKLRDYLVINSFYLKRGIFFFLFNLPRTIIEFSFVYLFFSRLKFHLIEIFSSFIRFSFRQFNSLIYTRSKTFFFQNFSFNFGLLQWKVALPGFLKTPYLPSRRCYSSLTRILQFTRLKNQCKFRFKFNFSLRFFLQVDNTNDLFFDFMKIQKIRKMLYLEEIDKTNCYFTKVFFKLCLLNLIKGKLFNIANNFDFINFFEFPNFLTRVFYFYSHKIDMALDRRNCLVTLVGVRSKIF